MKLAKYKPINGLSLWQDFQNQISQLLDFPFANFPICKEEFRLPSLDAWEDKDKIYIEAELPGFEQKDIKVNLKGNNLEISAKRDHQKQEKKKNCCRLERFQGEFYRRISLPAYADSSKAKADYKKGVLKLTFPKREEAKAKEVQIEVN